MKSKRTMISKGLSVQYEKRSDGRRGRITEASKTERCLEVLATNYKVVGECHEWLGPFTEGGYAMLGLARPEGVSNRAHRALIQLSGVVLTKADVVMHKCDNIKCINRRHLVVGTHKQNTEDMLSKGRGRWQGE